MVVDQQTAAIAQAVATGFEKKPKRLPSWLFYDEEGDRLFQQIMRMPEYYLTRAEYEILDVHKEALLDTFCEGSCAFNLVELGAGDGLKTELLLKFFDAQAVDFVYTPVDVSESVLQTLQKRVQQSTPNLVVKPINKRYEQALADLNLAEERKVLLFLGANIGNFAFADAAAFLQKVAAAMHENDLLVVGFDLKKDPHLILQAYNDHAGITRQFNLNLLRRLNRELGADFVPEKFTHYATYDPETGLTKSYLVSQHDQRVIIPALDSSFDFKRWEVIHTEVSLKYDYGMIETLALSAGLSVKRKFHDAKKYFVDVVMEKVSG